ncbi:hypothetical protein [Mycobacterium sp. 1274756.6]|uniref:hypothetical protein n=1 Tax=Mycobacterium sp. 1274756.6 TaxID=1834076 RepID=UPI0007FF32CF|nr:hypothetical protein [Mycobacterium sp. 1274756.6]OBJ74376.1 hypothetical protein A5643_01590 [Mycobacterium sp. 1274756.6]
MKVNHSDRRRAAALVTHRASLSVVGVDAVFKDASEAGRSTQLLVAAIDLYLSIAGELRTDAALELIGEFLVGCAKADGVKAPAARVILARQSRDRDAFNELLTAANGTPGGPTELVGSVVDQLAMLLPELAAPGGLAQLRRWAARAGSQEVSGE